ncbi:MAG: hypothetical protein IJW19_05395 [Clostridia bacterium]|nr:hypothetical protein [Clostridia bacterium]
MELWEEILLHALKNCNKTKRKRLEKVISSKCYFALKSIKSIISDSSLNDRECFLKIEEIICVLEGIGSNGGSRHDY